jgi:histidine ammonia-lyase
MNSTCECSCGQSVIALNGKGLTIEQVVKVARQGSAVAIADEAMDTIKISRQIVEEIAKQDRPFYGVNTGTGANRTVRIPEEELEAFQRRIILSHCICIEEQMEEANVRAAMVTRINGILKGAAGVQPEIVVLLKEMLNRGIHPLVPMTGSIGASDIGPLSHIALPLIGLGEVMYKGVRTSSVEAFEAENLKPVILGAKDGLGIINSNAVAVGAGALALWDCRKLLDLADLSYALNLEAFQGNTSPLRMESFEQRPHRGQRESAERITKILQDSFLWQPGRVTRAVQDPLSYRCTPQVHGACHDALEFITTTLEIELNSMGDNPMVLLGKRDMMSNGQFHILNIAQGFELLRIAIAHVASTMCARMFRLMDPTQSGLPAFLSPTPGRCCGYSTLQKTIDDLNSQIRQLAHPVSMDYLPLGRDVEDLCTMAPLAIRKTAQALKKLEYLVAIEFMVSSQAIDLISPRPVLGIGTRKAYEQVRQVIPFLEEDRIVAADINKVHASVVKPLL